MGINLGPSPFGRPVQDACLLAGGGGPAADLTTTLTVGTNGGTVRGYNGSGFGNYGSLSSGAFAGETINTIRVDSSGSLLDILFASNANPVDAISVAFSGGPTVVAKWNGSNTYRASGANAAAAFTYMDSTIGVGNPVSITVSEVEFDAVTYNYLLVLGSDTGNTVGNNYGGYSSLAPYGDISPNVYGTGTFNRLYAREAQRVRLSFVSNAQPGSATTITCNIEGAPDNPYSLVWDGFASYEEEDNTIASDLYTYLTGLDDGTVLGVSLETTAP